MEEESEHPQTISLRLSNGLIVRSYSIDGGHSTQTYVCLSFGSVTLHSLRLLLSTSRRALQSGTTGLRKPASCDPIRVRGDQAFVERFCATVGFFSNVRRLLPNYNYLSDIGDLLFFFLGT